MASMVNSKVINGQYGKYESKNGHYHGQCEVNNSPYGKCKSEQWSVW